VGRDVVVIGGGMTAVDAAVQSKLLGAQNVTMVYRRGKEHMSASAYEQDHATSHGVTILYGASPVKILGAGAVEGIEFAYQGGESFTLKADQVFKAIGQTLVGEPIAKDGKKLVKRAGKVWAGGDCAAGGEDLTVTAVAEGRDAAEEIHSTLMGRGA
jgi:glutamate synthase (NADPH/NADH) small chain